jgi:hypothetical protein
MEGKQPADIYIYIYIYIYIEALNFDLKFFSFFTEESSKDGQIKPFKARNTGQRPDIVDGEDESEKLDN